MSHYYNFSIRFSPPFRIKKYPSHERHVKATTHLYEEKTYLVLLLRDIIHLYPSLPRPPRYAKRCGQAPNKGRIEVGFCQI